MEIASVRALKAEIAERVIRPWVMEARDANRIGLSARSLRRRTGVEPAIALGITRGRGGDYGLAVRIQRRGLDRDGEFRERVESLSRQEADIRYIGAITKGTLGPAPPWHRDRQRPLLIGSSVGHFAITAGTLGAFALHRKTRRPVILSNNHVLANEDLAKIGDPILQPGVYDGGRRGRDTIGALLDAVPLKAAGSNLVDAAVASLDPGIGFDPRTLTGLGMLRGVRAEPIEPGDRVAKVGRTTGLTRGVVTAIELDDVVVGYERGDIAFDRQIEIESLDHDPSGGPFSAGGDSGSVIVDDQGLACALLFAGSDQGGSNGQGLTYANEIGPALEQLNLELAIEALIT